MKQASILKVFRDIGVTLFILMPGVTTISDGQTLANLWNFTGGTDGSAPQSVLVQGIDGNFYGTTRAGGTSTNCPGGCGTVFRITPTGSFTNLYSFRGSDGEFPQSGLVQGIDGNLYGTARSGGNTNLLTNVGYGTVFRISLSGKLTNLHVFASNPIYNGYPSTNSDGAYPGGLVQGRDGSFYGTTEAGGTSTNCPVGCGTVFQITPSGVFTNLHSFTGVDGEDSDAPLIQGSDGNMYGATQYGGYTNLDGGYGYGTVFRVSTGGSFTNLYDFTGVDATQPYGNMALGSDGNFYGTSGAGSSGYGTFYRVDPNGSYTNLYTFPLYNNGGYPAGLVQGSDGNFYGTTTLGGTNKYNVGGSLGYGTIFQITPNGSLTTFYEFHGNDGFEPVATVVQGSDGSFYGVTSYGGYTNLNGGYGYGTVFKLTIPLNPPANQISGVQVTGSDIAISVPSVAGETYQLQFSTNLTSGSWSNVAGVSATNCIGSLLTLTNLGGAAGLQGFYRLDVTP